MSDEKLFTVRGLVYVLFTISCQPTLATDYFISSKGSDAANGLSGEAGAQGKNTGPFKTLAPLTKIKWQNGDRVLLACGQRFQGPLRLSIQSNLPGVLSVSRYGDCPTNDQPTIDGRVPVDTAFSKSWQVTKHDQPVVQVFSGDVPMTRARFPKTSYLIFPRGTISSVDRIPLHPSLFDKDLFGAVILARTQEWLIEEKKVIDPNWQFESQLRYPLRTDAGFYLTGKEWMIDDDHSWTYDFASKTLHIRDKTVKQKSVVYAGNLLEIEGRGSVAIEGIAFNGAGADAINVKLDGVVNINDVIITRAAGNGISITGTSYAQISHSHIEDTAQDGIFFAEVTRAVVKHNLVKNAGLYLGPNKSLAAINAHRTQAATIEGNEVLRAAYIGIRFAGDARIRGNLIEEACLYLADCAAIYTWRRGIHDVRPPVEISGNAVINVHGDATVKFGVTDWFAGIYLDEWTRKADVHSNIILNSAQGIYLHNARNNIVEGNYILGARHRAIVEKDDALELIAASTATQELPNKIIGNTEFKDPKMWSLQRIDNLDLNINKNIRMLVVTGRVDNNAHKILVPSGCYGIPLGRPQALLTSVAARIFFCN